MTDVLREELERIAAGAPVAHVPSDTFARGRRARGRERALTVAASVLSVVVLAGMVAGAAGLVGRGQEPLPADGTLPRGVPSSFWRIPGGADLGAPATDLAIGRGAAVQISGDDEPVVVGDDGVFHPVVLPGFEVPDHTVEISPDGRSLAWGWAEAGPGSQRVLGVRIADLTTGAVREVAIGERRDAFLYSFSWSPDSRWLVWEGKGEAGRIGPDDDVSAPVPSPGDDIIEYAVDDDGLVLVANRGAVLRWDGSLLSRERREQGWFPSVTDPSDGVLVETIQRGGPDSDTFTTLHRRLVDGEVVDDRIESLTDQDWYRQLGWVDDQHMLVDTGSPDEDGLRLQLIDLTDPLETTATVVGEVGSTFVTSVAVDLMTLDQPTVDRPTPPWVAGETAASTWDRLTSPWAVGAAGLVLLLGAAWWVRRRRTPAL